MILILRDLRKAAMMSEQHQPQFEPGQQVRLAYTDPVVPGIVVREEWTDAFTVDEGGELVLEFGDDLERAPDEGDVPAVFHEMCRVVTDTPVPEQHRRRASLREVKREYLAADGTVARQAAVSAAEGILWGWVR